MLNIFMNNQIISEQAMIAIKSCKVIYTPRGPAAEYGKVATNPYKGCGLNCIYCYVTNIPGVTLVGHHSNGKLRDTYLEQLGSDLLTIKKKNISGLEIFITFMSDPWNPGDGKLFTGKIIDLIHQYGNTVNCLTKSGIDSITDLSRFGGGDKYGATITTLNSSLTAQYEPLAPPPAQRIEAIKEYSRAIGRENTWVSIEPSFDFNGAADVIKELDEYVGTFKIGKMNYRKTDIDWYNYCNNLLELSSQVNSEIYVKSSLHPYLPDKCFREINYLGHSGVWRQATWNILKEHLWARKNNPYFLKLEQIRKGIRVKSLKDDTVFEYYRLI